MEIHLKCNLSAPFKSISSIVCDINDASKRVLLFNAYVQRQFGLHLVMALVLGTSQQIDRPHLRQFLPAPTHNKQLNFPYFGSTLLPLPIPARLHQRHPPANPQPKRNIRIWIPNPIGILYVDGVFFWGKFVVYGQAGGGWAVLGGYFGQGGIGY